MDNILNEFSTEVNGTRYMQPEVYTNEGNAFIDNLRNSQAQRNAEINAQTTNLGTYPASQSNLGGLGGGESTFIAKYETAPTVDIVNTLRAKNQALALEQAMKNDLDYWSKEYDNALTAARKRAAAKAATPVSTGDSDETKGEVEKTVKTPQQFYGVPDTTVEENDTHYIYTDPSTGKKTYVSKEYMNKIYDKDTGRITDDGMVILDTMQMLPGLGR